MGERIKQIGEEIKKIFPDLINDLKFKVTSKETPNYNCLAWADLYNDRWMQPFPPPFPLDGVEYFWPPGALKGPEIECLIDAYIKMGFQVCFDGNIEINHRKIALYKDAKNHWTHAARLSKDGYWESKLGQNVDIQHGTPYSIEGTKYGNVACFMKKKI